MKFTSLSTILVCKEAKMNNLFNHHGAGPPEAWGPMQPHRLHRLKPGPVKHCRNDETGLIRFSSVLLKCWRWLQSTTLHQLEFPNVLFVILKTGVIRLFLFLVFIGMSCGQRSDSSLIEIWETMHYAPVLDGPA